MIEYSIKDLLIVILKKFYIIILGIICFALLAIYNGEVSIKKRWTIIVNTRQKKPLAP